MKKLLLFAIVALLFVAGGTGQAQTKQKPTSTKKATTQRDKALYYRGWLKTRTDNGYYYGVYIEIDERVEKFIEENKNKTHLKDKRETIHQFD